MSKCSASEKERFLKIILKPHLSEKSNLLAEKERQYVFQVATDANKSEIKRAVEFLFDVDVAGVQTCNVKGKKKQFRQKMGQRKATKKAYVKLHEGYEIPYILGE
jgi:large subunit ribosomal protein L23